MIPFKAWWCVDVIAVVDGKTLNVVIYDTWISKIRHIYHTWHVNPGVRQINSKSLQISLSLCLLLSLQLHLLVRARMHQSILLRLALLFSRVQTLCINKLVFVLDL